MDLDAATWLQICPLLTAIPVSVCSLPPQGFPLSFVRARFLCAANRTRNTDFSSPDGGELLSAVQRDRITRRL
ncbi:hypothetical protein ASPCAL01771 [Aspergillus calidoustus]|uniref:Uncharacterized protein n=1 Tax=Aspergillus calidoustus TaxID=454130 RepID=A0A0U5GQL9_ASPCI|nr:hypothetical protein ASPCAL01771 [Aspergillus calidoustus]